MSQYLNHDVQTLAMFKTMPNADPINIMAMDITNP